MNLPNQLTVLRIVLTPIFVWMLFTGNPAILIGSFAIFVVATLTDWYDGYVARKYGEVSKWGKFLDPLADKILVSAGLISFCILGYFPDWMVVIVIVRDVIITCLRTYGLVKGQPITTNFFAKMKTFGQMTLLYIVFILHLFVKSNSDSELVRILTVVAESNLIFVLMAMITLTTVVSGLIYLVVNRFHMRRMLIALFRLFVPSDI